MSRSAGIDIGSATIKFAILQDGALTRREVVAATSRPLQAAAELLRLVPPDTPLTATGYGRDMLETRHAIPTISEIKAHGLGARFLFPHCQVVIDIGGQDVKVIAVDPQGRVRRFEMNDRCAAGTGRFLEIMAQRLNYSLAEFAAAALRGREGIKINSLCTVFAESEVVGLLNRDCALEDISRALHLSVVHRIHSMFSRLEASGPIAVTGGGARNTCLIHLLQTTLAAEVSGSDLSQCAGAIGCAIVAGQAGR